MRVSTITLSPAIDRTYYVDNLTVNALNRAWQVKTNMGGKGINFSAIIAQSGLSCRACGFLGNGGESIEEFLKAREIETDFVYTQGNIRTNVKICDLEKGTYTDINECGFAISEKDERRLFEKVEKTAADSDFLYMGGTLPPGLSENTYARLIEAGRRNGAVTVLDSSGAALQNGIAAVPDIVKPNRAEAENLLGRRIKSLSDAVSAARDIAAGGIETVLITLGGDGAVCVSENTAYRVYPLCVPVKSTVGAGDSFLAGFVYARVRSMGTVSALKYAMSFSAAKIQKEGTDIPTLDELCANVGTITCETIEN